MDHFVPSASNAYRPRLLRRPWLLFFLALTLGTEGFLVANLVARQTDQTFLAAVVPAEVIALTNTEREVNNVGDVTPNTLLDAAAQAKADDMAKLGYFSHTGPDGKTPWQWIAESGYRYQYAGENLAVRFIDSQDVVNAWMQSPSHRANMVKAVYTDIGVGVAQGLFEGAPATYVVQYFASPAPESASASAPAPVAGSPAAVAAAPAAAQLPSAQTPQPRSAQVEGAAIAPTSAPGNGFTQSLARAITRALANPQQLSLWVLGAVGLLLVVVLVLTFFIHPRIQPTNMLVSGVLVAALALSFVALDSHLSEGGTAPDGTQAAGVIEASRPGSVLIGQPAESTSYALFPQAP